MRETEKVYTADDEEPDCNRCDNCNCSDEFCSENCGPEHFWNCYFRTVCVDTRKKLF